MINVYVYLLDTMADWETGYLLAELNSRRFFKRLCPYLVLLIDDELLFIDVL